jgi:imidazolonepropionase-like amidohydrolase
LLSATKEGGKIMMRPHELGQIKDGYLADLILVDGDPLADITVLQKPERILAVMKDGTFYKTPQVADGSYNSVSNSGRN